MRDMGGFFRRHWPLWAALASLWAAIAILLLLALRANQHHFVYAIDDAYIHMALAKNLVLHHVWGVTPYAFSWCSSSPLWTAILAMSYFIFGVHECTLLILTILAASGLCIVAYRLLRDRGLGNVATIIAMALLLLLTPAASLVFTGQEHLLHLLLTILFVFFSADDLSQRPGVHRFAMLLALAPLLCMARYEGLFLLTAVSGLYVLRQRLASALALVGGGTAPVIITGLIAQSHGWYFLPTSLMIKGNTLDGLSLHALTHFLGNALHNLIAAPSIAFLLVISSCGLALVVSRKQSLWAWENVALIELFAMLAAHVVLAKTGMLSLSRYDGYLVGAAVMVFAACWNAGWSQALLGMVSAPRARVMVLAVAAITLLPRAFTVTLNVPISSHNIFEQQYQMARFVHQYYEGRHVGINDIGAVDFFADVRLLDYGGLATMQVAQAMRAHALDNNVIARMGAASQLDLAMVYDDYLFGAGPPPPGWIRVARWRLTDARVVNPAVSFYATSPAGAAYLLVRLAAFERQLPSSVIAEVLPLPRQQFASSRPTSARLQRSMENK